MVQPARAIATPDKLIQKYFLKPGTFCEWRMALFISVLFMRASLLLFRRVGGSNGRCAVRVTHAAFENSPHNDKEHWHQENRQERCRNHAAGDARADRVLAG